jgi:hypothetical protein
LSEAAIGSQHHCYLLQAQVRLLAIVTELPAVLFVANEPKQMACIKWVTCLSRRPDMFPQYAISNDELSEADIPIFADEWDDQLIHFALSFDGYKYTADYPATSAVLRLSRFTLPLRQAFAETGNLPEQLSLNTLRAGLFWEERRVVHNMQWRLTEQEANYIRALVEAIRDAVRIRASTQSPRVSRDGEMEG